MMAEENADLVRKILERAKSIEEGIEDLRAALDAFHKKVRKAITG